MNEANEPAALTAELQDELRQRVFGADGFMRLTQVIRYGGRLTRHSLRPVALAARSKPLQRPNAGPLPHDRTKKHPLNEFDAELLLKGLGIADADGRIKASMRGKYDQVNAFLRILGATVAQEKSAVLGIVDCGCGKAYLTFAAYFYLTQAKRRRVKVLGIDRNREIIDGAKALAHDLGVADEVQFVESDVATAQPDFKPTIVLSLHACDTATDEALARAVAWGSRHILAAPCCQHELHKNLPGGGPMRAVLRQGIMRARLADLLTDTFRAQLLRIVGYRVQVVEFVEPSATARNIMLRAEAAVQPQQGAALREYLELRDFWGVTPWLERRLLVDFPSLLLV